MTELAALLIASEAVKRVQGTENDFACPKIIFLTWATVENELWPLQFALDRQ